jgi:hypothetical protein
MNIKKYLDSTYLKTADQAGLDERRQICQGGHRFYSRSY